MQPISIIGMGAVSSAGIGLDAGWNAVAQGADGLSEFLRCETGLKQPPLCGQVAADLSGIVGRSCANRSIELALIAAREAARNVDTRSSGLKLGVVAATTVAGMARSELFFKAILSDPSVMTQAATELSHHEPATLTAELAVEFGAVQCLTVSTACSAGLHAIGLAARLIDRGQCDLCLAVGADALSILTIRGFASLTLLAPGGCRPFDSQRTGISLGEGAGALLLASTHAAESLGAPTLAYVRGWGATSDCHHMTAPHPDGAGAAAAIRSALEDARIDARKIDFVASHGTGTPDNDLAEVKALRTVFGEVPPFCSMKRTLGHTLGASGTLETVYALKALLCDTIPATGGYLSFDDAIGAAPSPLQHKPTRTVLKNAFGFGGNNACVVFAKDTR